MATNIPPHNLGEVVQAAIALINDRDCSLADLMKHVKGPDFPTGGEILNSRSELKEIYETGQGSVRLRGEYKIENGSASKAEILITSIPFAVDKSTIVEKVGELIAARKVPQLLDVRDESTTDVRIALELNKDADPDVAMAYLFKNTPLQNNFSVNLTCLVPVPESSVTRPDCLNLKRMLELFIDFRFETVKRRFSYDLRILERRIHILNGFKTIFDALDHVLKIIRQSDGKADSAGKLQQRFDLDAAQTDAILEIPIYKLSRTEIKKMLDELTDKRRQAKELKTLLASKARLWGVVKQELEEVAKTYPDKRRTKVGRRQAEEVEFDPEAYMVKEDAVITVSTDGWIRRVGVIKDITKARLREGDSLMAVLGGSTVENLVFFSNYGSAYTLRIGDIPAARSGYGDPAQKLFKFKDGERVVGAISLDPRMMKSATIGHQKSHRARSCPCSTDNRMKRAVPIGQGIGVSSAGMGVRFELAAFQEPSTRLGRKYMKVKEGEEVTGIGFLDHQSDSSLIAVASVRGRVLLCQAEEVALLSGPGRGVTVLKLEENDRVLGFRLLKEKTDQFILLKEDGAKLAVSSKKYQVVSRGGKGHAMFKRGLLNGVEPSEVMLPVFPADGPT